MAKFEVIHPLLDAKPGDMMRSGLHTIDVDGAESLTVTRFDEDEDDEGVAQHRGLVVEFKDADDATIGVAYLEPGQVIRKKI